MGKNNRHQKNLKSEKAKVRLKAKKGPNNLPKGLNVTDTTFKVKKIVIREQLKRHDETEILSRRKLNVKDLLTRLQHHNSTVRQEAIKELKDMLTEYSMEILSAELRSLLQGISALSLDKEKEIRRDSLKVLNLILEKISSDQLRPFSELIISYLCCAMTHIDPNIKEDSLLFLDVIAENSSSLLAKNAEKILPNFLDMISKLKTESNAGRQLVTTLSSKNTSLKWRTKVLARLSSIFLSIVIDRRSRIFENDLCNDKTVTVGSNDRHFEIYNRNNLNICQIDFNENQNGLNEGNSELDELMKYTKVLMPLMFDSWLEVMPKKNTIGLTFDGVINLESSHLLKSISKVVQHLIEYFELLEEDNDQSLDHRDWLSKNYLDAIGKSLFDKFPYSRTKNFEKSRKRQEDFEKNNHSGANNDNDNCLEENLLLCYAYLWFLTSKRSEKIEETSSKDICVRILGYIDERLNNWSSTDAVVISQLVKLLRIIFLRGSKMFYKSGLSLGENLSTIIDVYSHSGKRHLQSQLFTILSEIALNHDLEELHNENAFRNFVTSLPGLLMKNSIHENTIVMLNRAVLQYGRWIRGELEKKHEKIIENAKKIEIIGSNDEKRSRLMICNLFYFVDEQIYY